jgi:photosystem II stability/assembly factor-like uncharacterized protein
MRIAAASVLVAALLVPVAGSAAHGEDDARASHEVAARSADAVRSRGKTSPSAISFWDEARGLLGTGWNPRGDRRCPGEVKLTTDGGHSFETVLETPGVVTWVETAGTDDGWAQVDRCSRHEAFPPQQLFYTSDGGESWAELPTSKAWTPSFATATAGFASFNKYPAPYPYRPEDGPLMRTSDGGASWEKVPIPCSYEATFSAPKPTHLLMACVDVIGAGSEYVQILHSSDAGETWTKRSRGVCPLLYYLQGMSFGDPDWGLVYADFATACKTRDGGRTWRPLDSGDYPRRPGANGWRARPWLIRSLQAAPGNEAIALFEYLNGAKLARSPDAGRTWTVLHRWRFR